MKIATTVFVAHAVIVAIVLFSFGSSAGQVNRNFVGSDTLKVVDAGKGAGLLVGSLGGTRVDKAP